MAVIGFICGLLGLPAILCCGLFSLPFAVPAWILGHKAHSVLAPPEVQTSLRGLSLAAKILGIVGVGLFALGILLRLLLFSGHFGLGWLGSQFGLSPGPTPPPAVPPPPPPVPPPPTPPGAP